MYALRERRQHVTQEDFEFAVAKVRTEGARRCVARALTVWTGSEEEPRGKHVCEQAVLIAHAIVIACCIYHYVINGGGFIAQKGECTPDAEQKSVSRSS